MHIDNLLQRLAKPAQRAIQSVGVTTIGQLTKFSEKEISELHGIGKNAMNTIKQTLNENGLAFLDKK